MWEYIHQLQCPSHASCAWSPCAALVSPPPCTKSPSQLLYLLHLHTNLSPSSEALDFWKMEKEGKEAGLREICRQRDGKGDRDEASNCLKSSTIKSQTVQDIDKSFHVGVFSISFQLMYNHFSSGKNRNPVL